MKEKPEKKDVKEQERSHMQSHEPSTPPEEKLDVQMATAEYSHQKIEELTDTLRRLQAEFENFKKWTDREKREREKFAAAQLIGKLLPLLDTFDEALKNSSQHKDSPLAKGIGMLHAQLLAILLGDGLRPIECLGRKFDSHYHDVMLKEKSGQEEGIVLEEFQRGYMLHDKVLRHSKVKVSGQ